MWWRSRRKESWLHNAIAHHLGIAQNMGMKSSLPPVLVHLPGVTSEIVDALRPHARVVEASSRSQLLSFLSPRSTGEGVAWRAVVLATDGSFQEDLRFLARIAEALPEGVLVATHPSPDLAQVMEAEAHGVAFLLHHPPDPGRLLAFLDPYLLEEGDHPIPEAAREEDLVVGSTPALTAAYRTVVRVARSSAAVLIAGESGTGKEAVARTLHRMSPRRDHPFVPVNCAALPEGLLEAELFGYERGAFTGAVGRSDGRFGRAHGGTLFLDEIGEMSVGLQAKLLRALETGEIDRLGGGAAKVDVRLVAATNRRLEGRISEGLFREDLYYRLSVVTIPLPPLRERPSDLIPLAEHFAALFARRHGREIRALSAEALAHLRKRSWPGNVRELRNVMDRAVLLSRGGVIRSVDLGAFDEAPHLAAVGPGEGQLGYPPTLSLAEVEERHLRRVLAHTSGHLGEAADILGIHRNTVSSRVRSLGIDPANPLDRTGTGGPGTLPAP